MLQSEAPCQQLCMSAKTGEGTGGQASPGGRTLSGGHWEPLKVVIGGVRSRLAP